MPKINGRWYEPDGNRGYVREGPNGEDVTPEDDARRDKVATAAFFVPLALKVAFVVVPIAIIYQACH